MCVLKCKHIGVDSSVCVKNCENMWLFVWGKNIWMSFQHGKMYRPCPCIYVWRCALMHVCVYTYMQMLMCPSVSAYEVCLCMSTWLYVSLWLCSCTYLTNPQKVTWPSLVCSNICQWNCYRRSSLKFSHTRDMKYFTRKYYTFTIMVIYCYRTFLKYFSI